MSSQGIQPAIEARDLEVRRGNVTVLTIPTLSVFPGRVLALIGPNGAGKSTLLLTLALLLPPKNGSVLIGGIPAKPGNLLPLRRRLAMVFQEPLLLDRAVAENVATGLKLRGMSRSERTNRVEFWLERFGIAQLARRRARSLSGGEAQRTSLARALALEPEVLFLDEPFSALDAPTRAAITVDLFAALRETKTAAILVSHDRDEALAWGDEIAVLIDGRLRQMGPPEMIFGAPVDAQVAAFVGVETIVPGNVVAQEDGLAQVQVSSQLVEVVSDLPTGTSVLLCLRPEDITLFPEVADDGKGDRGSARNRLRGKVTGLAPWGAQVSVKVDTGFSLTASITRRSAAELNVMVGVPVSVSFKATSAHLIPRV